MLLLPSSLQYDLVRNFINQAQKNIETIARRVSGGNWIYTSAKEKLNLKMAVNMMIELVMCLFSSLFKISCKITFLNIILMCKK